MDLAVTCSFEDGITHLWDLHSGTPLLTYQSNKAERQGVDIPIHGKLLVASQGDKPAISIWAWQRAQPLMKFAIPEKVTGLVVSKSMSYCVGGSVSGKLYIWEICSGELLRVLDAHYGKINVVRFTDDDGLLLTGGEDAAVNVWEVGGLLSDDEAHGMVSSGSKSNSSGNSTLYSWTDHALAITDIHVGLGGSSGRVVTSSLDCTCKVWDLGKGVLLCTLVFPVYISAVTMDPCEYRIFGGGGGNGEIYAAELYHFGDRDGGYQAVQSQSAVEKKANNMFVGHTAPITRLSMSYDGTLLLSASEDSKAIVWDVQCRQQLRTFSQHKGPINFAMTLPRPNVDLFSTELPALPPFAQFKRFAKANSGPSVAGSPIVLNPVSMRSLPKVVPLLSAPLATITASAASSHQKFAETSSTATRSNVAETLGAHDKNVAKIMEKEVQNTKLKQLNQDLYQYAVNKLVTESEMAERPKKVKKTTQSSATSSS